MSSRVMLAREPQKGREGGPGILCWFSLSVHSSSTTSTSQRSIFLSLLSSLLSPCSHSHVLYCYYTSTTTFVCLCCFNLMDLTYSVHLSVWYSVKRNIKLWDQGQANGKTCNLFPCKQHFTYWALQIYYL